MKNLPQTSYRCLKPKSSHACLSHSKVLAKHFHFHCHFLWIRCVGDFCPPPSRKKKFLSSFATSSYRSEQCATIAAAKSLINSFVQNKDKQKEDLEESNQLIVSLCARSDITFKKLSTWAEKSELSCNFSLLLARVVKQLALLARTIVHWPLQHLETAMGVKVDAQSNPDHPYVRSVQRMTELAFTHQRMPWFWLKPLWYASGYGVEYDMHLQSLLHFTRKV